MEDARRTYRHYQIAAIALGLASAVFGFAGSVRADDAAAKTVVQQLSAPSPVITYYGPTARHAKITQTPTASRKGFHLRRYARGENEDGWYAIAGAGSGAVALLSGAALDTDNMRLQKRAKIGTGQLGFARNVGNGRMTLGYLRHDNDRDALVPYYAGPGSQNLAALTLSFKH